MYISQVLKTHRTTRPCRLIIYIYINTDRSYNSPLVYGLGSCSSGALSSAGDKPSALEPSSRVAGASAMGRGGIAKSPLGLFPLSEELGDQFEHLRMRSLIVTHRDVSYLNIELNSEY